MNPPREFYPRKIRAIENTGDADDPLVAEDFERLILRRESDPVKMDCKARGKNSQVKINPCERGETERNAEDVQSFHGEIYDPVKRVTMLQRRPVVAL